MAGQVPADDLDLGRRAGVAPSAPERLDVGAERRPEQQQRRLLAGAGEPGEDEVSHGAPPGPSWALEDRVGDRAGLAEVVADVAGCRRSRRAGRRRRPRRGAAIAAGSTSRPPTSSAACDAAVTASSSSRCSAGHSACQAPSGRSSTPVAEARWSCAASCGACSAAARTSTASTGLRLWGIVEEPPRPGAAPSRSSPTSGRPSSSTSAASDAERVGRGARARRRSRSPVPRRVCHGSAGRSPSAVGEGGGDGGRVGVRRQVGQPARGCRPRRRTARGAARGPRRRRRRRRRRAASHCAALRPKVVGTAYWVSVRPAMTASRWVRASRGEVVGGRDQVVARPGAARRGRAAPARCRARPGW